MTPLHMSILPPIHVDNLSSHLHNGITRERTTGVIPRRPEVTTKQHTQTIAELLQQRRGDGYQSDAAREIGCSRQIYGAWESGHFIPGDEWAEKLAAYLERDLEEIVLRLYNDRAKKRDPEAPIIHGPSRWFVRPIQAYAEAA